MFNNPLSNHLNKFFNRNNQNNGAVGRSANDAAERLKARHDKARGTDKAGEAAGAEAEETKKNKGRRNYRDAYESAKSGTPEKTGAASEDTVELSPMEQRKKQLDKIMEKVEEDFAAKYPGLAKKDAEAAAAGKSVTKTEQSEVVTSDDPSTMDMLKDKEGINGFINDMPLFKEFKTSLMDAFKRMDSATSGSISAQYELNYTSMQYIANEAGGYELQETSLNIKLDLNYVKAASGGKTGAEIAKAIENAEDFESFAAVLKDISDQQAAMGGTDGAAEGAAASEGSVKSDVMSKYLDDNGKPMSAKQLMNSLFKEVGPDGIMKGMQDYFGSEATAGRIVDFATAFFPLSSEFKDGGDTEDARKAFSDRMGKAIQKGFDEAIGKIGGNYDGKVKDGVDKTHELVFKGLEDFVKNGTKKTEEEEQKQKALEEFAFSFEMSYSKKTTSVSYGSQPQQSSTVNTEA